jgi:hypothetical protein
MAIALALLDPVLHVAAGAVHFFIRIAGPGLGPVSQFAMKRGSAAPCVDSALATTRPSRLQLAPVVHLNCLKRRAGLPWSA